ncbi:MAG: cytochrome-c peroxidase [Gammaproteobacteria bacterium]|nr:MAG: cytochrome-c peroxidase [Gammaproteobacteria bacterium]
MKKIVTTFLILLFTNISSAQTIAGLPPLPIPDNNPQTAEKIALGQKLFNDPRFSADGTISCASCHQTSKAFTDGLPHAKGIKGLTGNRNAPTVVNAAYYTSFFHDGRRESLEQQSLDPITNPIEHGLTNPEQILAVIQQDFDYLKSFLDVFSVTAEKITTTHVAKALASYERTLISGNSPFDQYFFQSNRKVLNESEARGLRIFRRKGNCANCHEISWDHALFTDNRFYNIGIGFGALDKILPNILAAKQTLILTDSQKSELGRFNVTGLINDTGKFKTPTLRNIALTAPYMHDGSLKTLREVVDYYDKGGEKNRFLDPAIFPLKLTEQEKNDLVAFMKKLTSPEYEVYLKAR